MNYDNLDEAERARRKAEQVAWREKRRVSTIFMLCCSFFEIIETIFIILILFLLSSVFFLRVLDSNIPAVQTAYEISFIFCFIGGIVIGFLIYKVFTRWMIKKLNLESKLSQEVIDHYIKKSKNEIEEELKQ